MRLYKYVAFQSLQEGLEWTYSEVWALGSRASHLHDTLSTALAVPRNDLLVVNLNPLLLGDTSLTKMQLPHLRCYLRYIIRKVLIEVFSQCI